MIYLISQLWVWLLLTAIFSALAGWAFAAERAAPGQRAQRRERDNLLNDILRFAGDASDPTDAIADEREVDGARRLLQLRDGRIAELEQSLEHARARADDLAGELAETQRRGPAEGEDGAELARLRGLVADYEAEQARTIDVETAPTVDAADENAESDAALRMWRLRYFEQRVRYLENHARSEPRAQPTPPAAVAPVEAWRAREAEARAAYLEDALRTQPQAAPVEIEATSLEPEPFAASADIDALLRWRLLYLERRVAHLQAREPVEPAATLAQVAPPLPVTPAADPDRWKWRARYLEARVRHLEQRRVAAPVQQALAAAPAPAAATPTPSPPRRRGAKPPVLGAARNGAPDDLTLIDGVSALQQGTLHALGIFHFDQIAAWSPDHVAWIDAYLRLQGRIDDEDWIEQAQALAENGVEALRRTVEEDVS